MKCTLCGFDFAEEQAEKACQSCPIMKGCRLIKCPNCGFETPPEPRMVKILDFLHNVRKLIWKQKIELSD